MTIERKYKNAAILVLIILIAIQLVRPARNESSNDTNDITRKYSVPGPVLSILKTSCYDCHSNHTAYPWYNHIQPVAWWMGHHVTEGKEELNFNEFTTYRIGRQYHKLEGISREINKGDMPLSSYTLIHHNAILTDTQKKTVTAWADSLHSAIKGAYPADSLSRPRHR